MCDWEGEGGGELSCVGDHILWKLNTLFLIRLRTYKIATTPQTQTYDRKKAWSSSLATVTFFSLFFIYWGGGVGDLSVLLLGMKK